MGVVYKARQVQMDRIVAVKMLSQEMAQDPNWVKRFEREARACSQLQHPNTIRVFDFGPTREHRLYMAMEFLDGRSLREVIADDAPLDGARVMKILIQCCASLAEAHGRGIIHRDIKPDNVFLLSMHGSPDFVKLLDFSVAKLLQENDGMRTQAGIVFGTPQYMSPEQGRGLPLDARSDLYALGILAYEMLTGMVPFHHDNPMAVLQMHVQKRLPPLPPNIAPSVQQVVYQALEKEPSKRYQSAGEMMQRCQEVAQQLGANTPGPQPPQAHHHAPAGPQHPPPAQHHVQPAAHQPPPQAHHHAPAQGPPNSIPAASNSFGPEQHTIIAGGGAPVTGNPNAPYGSQNPAAAQTIVAGRPPPELAAIRQQQGGPGPHGGGPGQHGGYPGPPQHGPGGPTASEAQTVIASAPESGPLAEARRALLAQAGAAPGLPGVPPANPHGDPGGGPPQTILIPNTDGVVSLSQQHQQHPQHARPTPAPMQAPRTPAGAQAMAPSVGPLFWAICIVSGLVVGVGAYLLVLLIA